MEGNDKHRLPRTCCWLFLPLLTILCLGCVDGDSGGTPVGESQYLIGPDGEAVYYRTPDGPDGFLEIDFTVASDSEIPQADAASFELLRDSLAWARDHNSVFFAGQLVPSADPSTIRVLLAAGQPSGWAADDHQVYRFGEPLPGADPTTFSSFEENTEWGRDRDNVYYGQTLIEGAEPETFRLLDGGAEGWARDVAYVYRDGERVDGLDATTFVLLEGGYFHDKNALYYRGDPVDGANLSTLQARAPRPGHDSSLAWDDNQLWFDGYPVTVRRNDGSIDTVDVNTLATTHTDTVLADADGVYARLIEHVDRPAHFYQIDLINPAAFVGGATHKDDVLSFTLQPADAGSLGAFDARERTDSLLRLGVYEIAPEAEVERLGCAYWRRDGRVFYHGVLVEGQSPNGFTPQDEAGQCRTETWLLEVLDEFQQ